jgi:hypothetical protein
VRELDRWAASRCLGSFEVSSFGGFAVSSFVFGFPVVKAALR